MAWTCTFRVQDSRCVAFCEAAPLLCAGVTVYAPLKKYGAGPGKTVGIVGIGGLGHLGILFARALGADQVVAISRYRVRKGCGLRLGRICL